MSLAAEQPAVEAHGVEKVYRVYRGHGRGWLKSKLAPWLPVERYAQESTALRDVELTIARGEAVGVLGRNGSGKSTLLRVLAGMTPPTRGEVRVHGALRCIMASGVGFNPRLTGRENVVFGSIAMGIPRATALARMDEIVAFAELAGEIEKPTMYYSQGMRARLALAVALQETPDVLILDEALSAGDAGFTERCRTRIDEICASGNTVLLATHSLTLVRRACTRALLLDGGRIVEDGTPARVAAAYQASLRGRRPPQRRDAGEGDGSMRLADAYLCGDDGRRRDAFAHGERLELHLLLDARRRVERPRIVLELMSVDQEVRVTQLGTHYLDAVTGQPATLQTGALHGRHELVVAWHENPLGSGEFFWRVSILPWTRDEAGQTRAHLRASAVCPFTSEAFPGRGWRRRTLFEPESVVTLSRVGQPA